MDPVDKLGEVLYTLQFLLDNVVMKASTYRAKLTYNGTVEHLFQAYWDIRKTSRTFREASWLLWPTCLLAAFSLLLSQITCTIASSYWYDSPQPPAYH